MHSNFSHHKFHATHISCRSLQFRPLKRKDKAKKVHSVTKTNPSSIATGAGKPENCNCAYCPYNLSEILRLSIIFVQWSSAPWNNLKGGVLLWKTMGKWFLNNIKLKENNSKYCAYGICEFVWKKIKPNFVVTVFKEWFLF